MEETKKNLSDADKEIVFSKTIKAGKRIYYVDVKKNRKDEMFLAITERKKNFSGTEEDPQINFEKHKIFLYQEDFEHFLTSLHEAVDFIQNAQGCAAERKEENTQESDINFDIKF